MRKLFSFFAYNDNEIIGILKCVNNDKKGGGGGELKEKK